MPVSAPFLFLFGAALGSFLNVVIFRNQAMADEGVRNPKHEGVRNPNPKVPDTLRRRVSGTLTQRFLTPFVTPSSRSHCPNCRATLRWWELIPLLSFILLRGQCARCRAAISIQYPVIELSMGIFALILFTPFELNFPFILAPLIKFIIISLLLILFVIDLRTMLLPDKFIILLSLFTVLYLIVFKLNLISALSGAVIGSGFLGLLWLLTKGRGLGLGDVKLVIPLGLLLGPANTALLLLLSFIIGGALSLWLLATHRATMKTPVPFGPFLITVAIVFIILPFLPQAIINIIFL